MPVNTSVKLQMTVEIALPALSSLYSVSDYYLFNDDRVKICIKFQGVHLVAHFSLFAKCELLDSRAVWHSSHFSQACFEINKK